MPSDDSIWSRDGVVDRSPGPNSPHYELVIDDGFTGVIDVPPEEGNYMTIGTINLSPSSTGSVTLKSSDPFDAPLIDPGFFTTEPDMHTAVTGKFL